jgi:hypothetical protein
MPSSKLFRILSACAVGALALTASTALPAAADTTDAPVTAAVPSAAAPAASPAYWLLTDNGGIMSFGGVQLYGSATNIGGTVVGMASSAGGQGYWIASSNGRVSAFGQARPLGSVIAFSSNPIVAITATPDGGGYWLVTRIGGVIPFGDAHNYGSTANLHLQAPIVGMSPTPDGQGYRLVASDGGVFTFGDAAFYGSTGSLRLNRPIVAMDGTADGAGYWLVASDGGVFSFGDAPFYGSTGNLRLVSPIVGMSRVPGGRGYWLAGADGGVFAFGSAPYRGSVGGIQLLHGVVALEEGPGTGYGVGITANEGLGPYPSGSTGYDISWPQCGGGLPGPHAVAIVGVNDGHAFSTNPCLGEEIAWAGPAHGLYINVNSPNGPSNGQGANGGAGTCSPSDPTCWSYNYGWNAALASVATATQSGGMAQQWWLDVETGNFWSGNLAANARVVQGAIDALHSRGLTVGIYSTHYQWGAITGGASFGVPVWVPTGIAMSNPGSWCNGSHSFNGGPVWIIQYGAGNFDGDYAC